MPVSPANIATLATAVVLLHLGGVAPGAEPSEAHWPQWRGPLGTGVAIGSAPLRWGDDSNIRWQVEIPGRGFSTPIIWGDRLFLTTAVAADGTTEGEEGARQSFDVMCLDRGTGAVIWKRTADVAAPHEGFHRTYGSYASISPITDGGRLYASFGSFGLSCYDLDGTLLWKTDFGVRMEMRRQFGEGSAPALHGDTLVHVFDHEGASFIVAVDAGSGAERWRVARDEPSTWSMPLITTFGGRAQAVVSGTTRVRSYDLATGEIIWECAGLGLNAIPCPVRFEDTVIVMSGYRDANIMSIRLGGQGDITGSDRVVWTSGRGASYTASPVLVDGKLYTVRDDGTISCFDARTGEASYVEERLPRGSRLKSSPIAAGGRLYVACESGEVHVVKLGTSYELLATNTLTDQFFVSSPVVVDGTIYLRSRERLYAIADAGP